MKRSLILLTSMFSSAAHAEKQSNIEFLPTDFTNQVVVNPLTGNEVPVRYDPAIDAATRLVETDLKEEDHHVFAPSCLFRNLREKELTLAWDEVIGCQITSSGPVKQKVTARYQFNLGRIQFCYLDLASGDPYCGSEMNLSPNYQTIQVNYGIGISSVFYFQARKPTGTSLLQYYNYYVGP